MENARYLEDGKLVVYKRRETFYARIHVSPQQYTWRSLKTSDETAAIRAAQRLFYKLEDRAEQGLPPISTKFSDVINDYIRYREKDHIQGRTRADNLRQIQRVARFWHAYAGTKAIEHIDDKVMGNFIPWRREYYSKLQTLPRNARLNPADKTLQWEMTLGKAIVKWAHHQQGLRGKQPLPTVTFTPRTKRVRPAFELPMYWRLRQTLLRRLRASSYPRIRRSRELLNDYVLILANSGMRVGEANNLRIQDAILFKDDLGRRNYRFVVRGKTGERDVILRASAAKYVDRQLTRRAGAAQDDWLFAMPDGSKLKTLIDQFNEVLKEADITRNGYGEKYTLYSLRHFYAVMALRQGLGVFEVSRNMGTSVQMIQQYYGKQATSLSFATRLGN